MFRNVFGREWARVDVLKNVGGTCPIAVTRYLLDRRLSIAGSVADIRSAES